MKTLNGSMKTVALSSHPNADPAAGMWQQQLGRAYGREEWGEAIRRNRVAGGEKGKAQGESKTG